MWPRLRFRLRTTRYRLLLKGQAGRGERPGSVMADGRTVKITVYEGVALIRYAMALAVFAAAWAVIEVVRRIVFECRRWGTDEDGDD